MNGNPAGEFFVEGVGERFVAERLFAAEVVDHGESVLANLPVAVAAVFPFGEVAGSDGMVFKVFFENGFDFGEGVEPFENGFALFAVVKAAIELFTDGVRKTSDFSGTHGFLQF